MQLEKILLKFVLFDPEQVGEYIHLDPSAVISVVEGRRRTCAYGWIDTATINLGAGGAHTVIDSMRIVARQIQDAIR